MHTLTVRCHKCEGTGMVSLVRRPRRMMVACPMCLGRGRVPLGFYVMASQGAEMVTRCDCCKQIRYCAPVPRLRVRYELCLCADCWHKGEALQASMPAEVTA